MFLFSFNIVVKAVKKVRYTNNNIIQGIQKDNNTLHELVGSNDGNIQKVNYKIQIRITSERYFFFIIISKSHVLFVPFFNFLK